MTICIGVFEICIQTILDLGQEVSLLGYRMKGLGILRNAGVIYNTN